MHCHACGDMMQQDLDSQGRLDWFCTNPDCNPEAKLGGSMWELLIDGKVITSLSNDELGATLEQIAMEMKRRKEPEMYATYGDVLAIGTRIRKVKDRE